jgi:hypothetical protein
VTALAARRTRVPSPLVVGTVVVAWIVAWFATAPLALWVTFDVLGLEPGTSLGEAVAFFLYDVPKVLLLLGIVTVVTLVRGFFPPEKGVGAPMIEDLS